ncbi:hypothetical protein H3966_12025 [Staphylococcus epidermidis]|uniref:hypothetical protein n=1 Tax=Staphylococcus epidermidis TaxID=1282 RepID=UPI001887CB94|nr:hypothetical protein [Staphylococcus epidermidis]MBF2224120.1 hypothetical protein [Staphylococcus epidermidis]MBF2226505.1 hypothetical protein [Staphylococcus epidermidis]
MWKMKEFKYIENIPEDYDEHKNIDEQINEFVTDNDIKEFEIVGYTATYSAEYSTDTIYTLIKYWEEQ